MREDFVYYDGTVAGSEWCAGEVYVGTVCHEPSSPIWGPGVATDGTSIAFAHERYGVETERHGRTSVDPSRALLITPGDQVTRCEADRRRTRNDWLVVPQHVLIGCLAAHDAAAADRPDRPFLTSDVPLRSRALARQRLLMHHIDEIAADALLVESVVLAIVDDVAREHARPRCTRAARPRTAEAHGRAVRHAQAYIAERFRERLSVSDVARHACLSPAHFATLFRRRLGIPVHTYITRLRLREAIVRIPDYEGRLTELALSLGFASGEHLSATFHTHVGLTPTEMLHAYARRGSRAAGECLLPLSTAPTSRSARSNGTQRCSTSPV